jgi:uncharacterized membrane protein
MKALFRLVFSLAVLFGAYLMFKITAPYLSFQTDIDFLLTKQSVLYIDAWRWSFYFHITCSLIVLALGIFQFNSYLRNRFISFHKIVGKIYVFLVLFICAPSGFIMGIYANGGMLTRLSFSCVSMFWWVFTFMLYSNIIKGRITQHKEFAIRSYALTLSALTLRLYVLIAPHFIHLSAKDMYALVSILSWLPNIIIAEFWIRYTREKQV